MAPLAPSLSTTLAASHLLLVFTSLVFTSSFLVHPEKKFGQPFGFQPGRAILTIYVYKWSVLVLVTPGFCPVSLQLVRSPTNVFGRPNSPAPRFFCFHLQIVGPGPGPGLIVAGVVVANRVRHVDQAAHEAHRSPTKSISRATFWQLETVDFRRFPLVFRWLHSPVKRRRQCNSRKSPSRSSRITELSASIFVHSLLVNQSDSCQGCRPGLCFLAFSI